MKRIASFVIAIAAFAATQSVSADIITDLANAIILEDFRFNDTSGTSYDAAANSANPGNFFSTVSPILDGVVTDGFGNLNASIKNNNDFGNPIVESADRSSGRVLGVMEVTWDFQSVLDPAENEELRITLISSGVSGVLAEFEIQREDDNTLTILGNAVGNTTDIAPVVLNGGSLSQIEKFIAVVDADLDADTFQIHYSSDAGASFTTLTGGDLDPARGLERMRMILNNDLLNDRVLIDRVYLAVIPEPATLGLLAIGLVGYFGRRQHA